MKLRGNLERQPPLAFAEPWPCRDEDASGTLRLRTAILLRHFRRSLVVPESAMGAGRLWRESGRRALI